jgi:hypothetical protein
MDDELFDGVFRCDDNRNLIVGGSMRYPQNQMHSDAGSVSPRIASFEILWWR